MSHRETIHNVGEFDLIERLSSIVGAVDAPMGIGDDAAILEQAGDRYLLATVDMYVEDVHFTRSGTLPGDVGRRVLAVNISDIAAMGGTPTYALVSLALPPDVPADYIEGVYRGLSQEANTYGIAIVGGNMTRTSGPIAIDLVLLGYVRKGDETLRHGAQDGHILAVTGSLGRAAAARLALTSPWQPSDRKLCRWIADQAVPTPRLEAAISMASGHIVSAMMDLSDGLSGDIVHLCKASGVGAVVYADKLPIQDEVRSVAVGLGIEPLELALSGGEDYELLVTLPESDVQECQRLTYPVTLTPIGRIVSLEQGLTLEEYGVRKPIDTRAWRHF
ncbi:MAG: thiamine-phosphate kinase [Chloroflexota bacterium]